MMNELVGITGYAQHGKDTAAQVLVDTFGFLRVGFADALKSMALVLNPYICNPDLLVIQEPARLAALVEEFGWEDCKKQPEVRRFLQVLGTEGVRDHLGKNAWVDALARTVEPALYDCLPREWQAAGYETNPFDEYDGVVIPDVRFLNEAQYIKEQGGIIIRVERPGFDNGVGTSHPSEAYIQDIEADITISAYSVEELQHLVKGALRERLV